MAAKKPMKLWYFPVRGRGEPIRMLLKLAGVAYEEQTIDFEQWPTRKEETPFGQLPVLEVNGVTLAQSQPIMRYLGREYGFAGANNLENAQLDAIGALIEDAWKSDGISGWIPIALGFKKPPEGSKEEHFKQRVRPSLDKYASLLEQFLVEHATSPLWNGDKITWVDVVVAEFFAKFPDFGEPDCLEAYPHIRALVDRVNALPPIRKHIEQRPKTVF